jgi:hypothetical protein
VISLFVRTGVTEEDMAIIKPTDMITVIEGYDTMRIFLEPVWQRQAGPPARSSF